MPKVYQIEIEETLQKVVDIEADSLDEAITEAKRRYREAEIVLDEECLMDTTFDDYEAKVLEIEGEYERKDISMNVTDTENSNGKIKKDKGRER